MQTLIVLVVVALAGFFVVRKLSKKAAGEEGCDCGCSSCVYAEKCSEEENDP